MRRFGILAILTSVICSEWIRFIKTIRSGFSLARPKRLEAQPSVIVTYSQGDKNMLNNITMDRTFPTCDEAEQAGFAHVRKWIDGKPDLGP